MNSSLQSLLVLCMMMQIISSDYPSARESQTLTLLKDNLYVMFGGQLDLFNQASNELWLLNITNLSSPVWYWIGGSNKSVVEPNYTKGEPGSRSGHAMTRMNNGSLILYSGFKSYSDYFSDLWRLDVPLTLSVPFRWEWIGGSNATNLAYSNTYPGSRFGSSLVTLGNGSLILFGGLVYNGGATPTIYLNDLWMLDISESGVSWRLISGSFVTQGNDYSKKGGPGSRAGQSMIILNNGSIALFGGVNYIYSDTDFYNDIWLLDLSNQVSWKWAIGGNGTVWSNFGAGGYPGGRSFSAMALSSSDSLILFGGSFTNGDSLIDTWIYYSKKNAWEWLGGDGSTNRNGSYSNSYYPSSRYYSSSIPLSDGSLFMFGGYIGGGGGLLNDMWIFNVTERKWHWIGGSSSVGDKGVYTNIYTNFDPTSNNTNPPNNTTPSNNTNSTPPILIITNTSIIISNTSVTNLTITSSIITIQDTLIVKENTLIQNSSIKLSQQSTMNLNGNIQITNSTITISSQSNIILNGCLSNMSKLVLVIDSSKENNSLIIKVSNCDQDITKFITFEFNDISKNYCNISTNTIKDGGIVSVFYVQKKDCNTLTNNPIEVLPMYALILIICGCALLIVIVMLVIFLVPGIRRKVFPKR